MQKPNETNQTQRTNSQQKLEKENATYQNTSHTQDTDTKKQKVILH
jgi:hypothetical protein